MTIGAVLALVATIVDEAPQALAIAETAIAAFKANDQAGIDAARTEALALANSLAPQ